MAQEKSYHWLDLAEMASVVGSLGGAAASLVTQNAIWASLPLSLAVTFNLANRKRLLELIRTDNQSSIATLTENLKENHAEITRLLTENQANNQSHLENLSLSLQGVEKLVEANHQQAEDLNQRLQNLDEQKQQLEQVVAELRHIENVSQAISINPNCAKFYFERGLSREYLGDKEGAIEDYNLAIRYEPNYPKAYYQRGILSADLGNRKKAVEDLRKAAKFYFEQGDIENYQKARDLTQEFHELSSHNTNGQNDKLIISNFFS